MAAAASGGAQRIDQGKSVYCVTFSSDGKWILSGGASRKIQLWDVKTGQELRSFVHRGWVQTVAFSPDAQWCVSGSRDCRMRLWNLATGKEIRSFDHRGWVVCGFFSPDGTTCFSLGGGGSAKGQAGLREWDPTTGRLMRELGLEAGGASSVGWGSLSRDGKRLATASGNDVIVWDVATGRPFRRLKGHTKFVWEVALSRSGQTCVSGGADKAFRFWHVSDQRCLKTVRQAGGVRALAISPDQQLLATAGEDSAIPRSRRLRPGQVIRPVYPIRLWSLPACRPVRAIKAHRWIVESLEFSPDGKTLVSGSFDGTVKLWDVKSRRLVRSFRADE